MGNKTQAHQRYKNADGKVVPGVTTILGVKNKPALVKWANNLGLQGIDSSKYRDKMADIGTLAHAMVEAYLKGEQADTSEYSTDDISKAENAVLSFHEWEKHHTIKPLLLEGQLVSEVFQYGGQIDFYGWVDGELTLLDFKTGKAIYPEMFIQLAAYERLLTENGHSVSTRRILRIGRDEDEGFDDRQVGGDTIKECWSNFKLCLAMYASDKIIRKER